MLFAKMTDDIQGPGDPITIWKRSPGVVDEIEVAIVIGKDGKDIPRDKAMDHVLGYTICNDVSGRELDVPPPGRRDKEMDGFLDWLNGKWMDGFAILGPAIVTKSEAGDLGDVQITSRISGDVRVQGSTRNVNIPWDELISFASSLFTLRAGDLITTGCRTAPARRSCCNRETSSRARSSGSGSSGIRSWPRLDRPPFFIGGTNRD